LKIDEEEQTVNVVIVNPNVEEAVKAEIEIPES